MSNSPLVSYKLISPNKSSPRKNKIDTITIHCVVGQASVESLGNLFVNPTRQASSNYGIGFDGRIGLYVEEKDRSWCSGGYDKYGNPILVNGISGSMNDERAVTIEVASDNFHPYAVTQKAMESLILLCADICKRNNIKKLLWKGNKSLVGKINEQNMTVHRWFANKACPGDYLYERHGYIANEVNKLLGNYSSVTTPPVTSNKQIYRVQTGAFGSKINAENLKTKLNKLGFDGYVINENNLFKVQVGAFTVKSNATNLSNSLKSKGFDNFIVTTNEVIKPSTTITVNSTVKLIGTKYTTGQNIPAGVRNKNYTVMQISNDKVLLKEILSWVYVKDVEFVK